MFPPGRGTRSKTQRLPKRKLAASNFTRDSTAQLEQSLQLPLMDSFPISLRTSPRGKRFSRVQPELRFEKKIKNKSKTVREKRESGRVNRRQALPKKHFLWLSETVFFFHSQAPLHESYSRYYSLNTFFFFGLPLYFFMSNRRKARRKTLTAKYFIPPKKFGLGNQTDHERKWPPNLWTEEVTWKIEAKLAQLKVSWQRVLFILFSKS